MLQNLFLWIVFVSRVTHILLEQLIVLHLPHLPWQFERINNNVDKFDRQFFEFHNPKGKMRNCVCAAAILPTSRDGETQPVARLDVCWVAVL